MKVLAFLLIFAMLPYALHAANQTAVDAQALVIQPNGCEVPLHDADQEGIAEAGPEINILPQKIQWTSEHLIPVDLKIFQRVIDRFNASLPPELTPPAVLNVSFLKKGIPRYIGNKNSEPLEIEMPHPSLFNINPENLKYIFGHEYAHTILFYNHWKKYGESIFDYLNKASRNLKKNWYDLLPKRKVIRELKMSLIEAKKAGDQKSLSFLDSQFNIAASDSPWIDLTADSIGLARVSGEGPFAALGEFFADIMSVLLWDSPLVMSNLAIRPIERAGILNAKETRHRRHSKTRDRIFAGMKSRDYSFRRSAKLQLNYNCHAYFTFTAAELWHWHLKSGFYKNKKAEFLHAVYEGINAYIDWHMARLETDPDFAVTIEESNEVLLREIQLRL